jgi:hypothetical protein
VFGLITPDLKGLITLLVSIFFFSQIILFI